MTTDSRSPVSLLANPEFLSLVGVQIARGIARSTILIALALYADRFVATGVVAGLFGSAYALSRLVFVLPVGRYVDLGNAKRYLLAGLGVLGLVLVGFAFVAGSRHVIVLRFFQGIGAVLLAISGTAIVGQIAPDEGRGRWIGTYKQAKAFSRLSGDLLGGALLYVYGFTVTYAVLFALVAIAGVLVFAFLRDVPGGRSEPAGASGAETILRLLEQRTVRALVLFRFVFSFGKRGVTLFLPIYARTAFGMSALAIGGILVGGKLVKALSQGYVGGASDRFGHRSWFIVAATVLYAIGAATIPLAAVAAGAFEPFRIAALGSGVAVRPAFVALFGSYLVLGVADSLRIPVSNTLFVNEGERLDAVASSLSLRLVPSQVGGIVGPVALGMLADVLSFSALFWFAAVVAVVAGGLFVGLYTAGAPDAAVAHADD